jgi:CubicO group peptidase (beta-lactamase class C family)
MKTKLLGSFLFSLLFFASFSTMFTTQATPTQKEVRDHSFLTDTSFDHLITILLKIGHYPSMSACIIKNTTVPWANGYGLYDIAHQKHATPHTIYVVASITKTVTSTALMQLYEQGFFGLNDDINMYLPFSLRNPNFPNDPITIRMILSHSSSLTPDPLSYHWFNFSQPPPIPFYPLPWLEEYLLPGGAYYNPQIWDTIYRPGEHMQYANINFDLAAFLVQQFSGEPFYKYCQDHIFTPLGMTHTSFCLPDLPLDDVAVPYLYQNRTYEPLPYYQLLHYPIGGLMTTVEDLSHFLIAHMNKGVYNGTRILENETVTLMHTIQPPGNVYYNFHYGLGFMVLTPLFEDTQYIGHSGDIPGSHTRMYMDPSENTGIICFFNSDRSTMMKKFVSLVMQHLLFEKADFLE